MATACAFLCAQAIQSQSRQGYPRTPWGGYPYAASYDSEVADPDVHCVLYDDAQILPQGAEVL